ncbi:MAG: MurR/RpiR family transcriptional regulator [Eubacteriales bacterium]|nr:MurR/RpiR family transcriptional regulator [Eubacteriales bacterium]
MFTNEVLADFNELELSIYNCILKNKENISYMTIKDLAEAAHVSTSTVLRFCKKMGFEGYTHFKLRYKESLQQENIMLKDADDVVLKNFIYRTESDDFRKTIAEASGILNTSRQIIFVGIGSSGTLGKYGARFFSNIGRFSLYVEDPWQPVLQNLSEKTVAIALSESGTTMQTIDIAHQLKERGCKLIAITNTSNSTLAKMADCNITYHVPELIINNVNITTQLPVIYIIETLARNLYIASK